MTEWMHKQITGWIIVVRKRRHGIKERQWQAKRCKVIRLMLHMSKSDHTEGPAQNLKGKKYWITGSVISHSAIIAPRTVSVLYLIRSLARRRKTQIFLSPPPGMPVKGPLIPRSEDQSQQGSHVCQKRRKKENMRVACQYGDQSKCKNNWVDRKNKNNRINKGRRSETGRSYSKEKNM